MVRVLVSPLLSASKPGQDIVFRFCVWVSPVKSFSACHLAWRRKPSAQHDYATSSSSTPINDTNYSTPTILNFVNIN